MKTRAKSGEESGRFQTPRVISRLHHIAFPINIKNAQVLTVTVKIDQSELYRNELFKEICTGVLSTPLPNLLAFYSIDILRASRVFSRCSSTIIQTPGTGYYNQLKIQNISEKRLHLPATLEKFTTRPRAFFTRGRKVLVTSIIPQRFTSAVRLKMSSGVHSMGSK